MKNDAPYSVQSHRAIAATQLVLCMMLGFVVIHAASADLTWDEAWSYLFYSHSLLGCTHFDTPANHPLSSILVWLATSLFGGSEFVIRLPNILAAALYLYATARLIRSVQSRLLAFALCALQPYLFEYFALSRGYGIAAALVQFGLVAQFFTVDKRERQGRMLVCCLLACFAVSSTVIVLYGLLAGGLAQALWYRHGIAAQLRWAAVFGVLGLAPIGLLLAVSRDGIAIFGSYAGFFNAVPRSVAAMFVSESWASATAATGLFAIVGLVFAARRHLDNRAIGLLLASSIGLAAMWFSSRLLGKPLPTARLLLPYLPLWGLTIIAVAENIQATSSSGARALDCAGAALCAALAVSYAQHLQFQSYADWPQDSHLQERLVRAVAANTCIPIDVWDRYGHVYYLNRWFGAQRGPADLNYPLILDVQTIR